MKSVISLKNITKQYGSKIIVHGIDLDVEEGKIYGLIGKNGAGKTTIMKMMLGMTSISSGTVQLFGESDVSKVKHKIGAMIETPTFFDNKSILENLVYHGILIGMKDPKREAKRVLELVGLEQEIHNKPKNISLGMRQKLGIARILMNSPKLLILDEPTNGLDPVANAEIRKLLLKLQQQENVTIFLSSHILGEMQKMANKYGFILDGKLVGEITEEEVEKSGLDLENYALKMMGADTND